VAFWHFIVIMIKADILQYHRSRRRVMVLSFMEQVPTQMPLGQGSSVKSVENTAKFCRHWKTYLYNLTCPP